MDTTRELTGSEPAPGEPTGGAAPAAPPETEPLQLLLFRLGRELFAISLAAVDEAVEVSSVERVPDMPEAMLGVCDVRGTLTPVYSPTGVLGAAPTVARAEEGVMLLLRFGPRRVGIAVDDVEDVLALDARSLRQPALPGVTDGIVLGIARVGRELVAVIDPAALLAACGASPASDPSSTGTDAAAPLRGAA